MWPESGEKPRSLRSGLTTGTCATACCIAACERLFSDCYPNEVIVTLPKGKEVSLGIEDCAMIDDAARASTIKDAGDDPDVTHGACVFVELRKTDSSEIRFKAGDGVGVVTRDGLELAVGEAAINRVPRKMMQEHLQRQAQCFGYTRGFEVTVGIVNGAALAQKTMNSRLGIIGGLSILGTSGIVRPYSCAAWIASIHQGMDVAKANGITHIAASTGNTSEAAIRQKYDLDEIALIEMGDFVGAVLKHLKKAPLSQLSICGGFGKITKLACGNMDLNSRASAIDFQFLADLAIKQGASEQVVRQMVTANTSIEAYQLSRNDGIDIADAICEQAREFAQSVAVDQTVIEVWAIDRKGEFIGHAGLVK